MFLLDPPARSHYYTENSSQYSWQYCREPKDIAGNGSSSVPAAGEGRAGTIPWVTASLWITDESGLFYVQADLSSVLGAHGSGVYTVRLWGRAPTGEQVQLTNYSIWVKP